MNAALAPSSSAVNFSTEPSRFSLRSGIGSVFSSVIVHAVLIGGVVFAMREGLMKETPPEATVEIGYQVFDEPPPPTPVVHHVKRSAEPETPVEKTSKVVDSTPKEMQDEKSDIAGTQVARKALQEIGSQEKGTADATPFYKIKPKYPRTALVEGAEGWVLLKVDIAETGDVQNVRVMGGEKRNLFETEARRAVEKWKYKPFIDHGGKPFKVVDHQVRVDFKLAEASQ